MDFDLLLLLLQNLTKFSPMSEWLWGSWFLLVIAMIMFQFADTSFYVRRKQQSDQRHQYLMLGNGCARVFADVMRNSSTPKYIQEEERGLVAGLIDGLCSALFESVAARVVPIIPAAAASVFFPRIAAPLAAIMVAVVAMRYYAAYLRQGLAHAIFFCFMSILLFMIFWTNGFLAALMVQIAVYFSMKVTHHTTLWLVSSRRLG
jgi:hypothetical protein